MRRLIIRPGAIGDCILSFPALGYLQTEYTEIWIPRPLVPLIRFANHVRPIASTGIDLVGVGDLPMPESLREELSNFDSIVSWYGTARDEFHRALAETGIHCDFHRALPPADFASYAADFFLAQVGARPGMLPRIDVRDVVTRDSVVIQPFSGSARKNWPLDRYRELARALPVRVEWTAGPEEFLPEAVRFDNLAKLASWMRGARLYIGNDSGITHLAAATGVPTLALLGPASTETWVPRGPNVATVRARDLDELGIATVLSAALPACAM